MISDALLGLTPGPIERPSGQGNGILGKDEFLRLFVAQLKNQDPLNPMDGKDLSAQLAQFSSLEQLIEMNQKLSAQADEGTAMTLAINANVALGAIGRSIVAAGDMVPVTGDGTAKITVALPENGVVTLRIFNESGVEVGKRVVGSLTAGRHKLALGEASEGLEPGLYRFEVEAVNSEGFDIETQTFIHALVDGVRYGPAGPVLLAGDLEIPLADVAEITQSQLSSQ